MSSVSEKTMIGKFDAIYAIESLPVSVKPILEEFADGPCCPMRLNRDSMMYTGNVITS